MKFNGVYVGMSLAGGVLAWSGLKNITVADYLRSIIKLGPVPVGPQDLAAAKSAVQTGKATGRFIPNIPAAGSPLANAVVASALTYQGRVPYEWGGETPNGWDCSGFVSWVLHHDNGIELPDDTHTTAIQFYTWKEAQTIPRDQAGPGDLACWVSHVGICLDNTTMINSPTFGKKTTVDKIWGTPAPVIRRPRAYAASVPK
jgi:cell wall-associated NlpC family hydrolase